MPPDTLDKKRILGYFTIYLIALVYGGFHAFVEIVDFALPTLSLSLVIRTVAFVLSLLLNGLTFLIFYTQLFRGDQTPSPNEITISRGSIYWLFFVCWFQIIITFITVVCGNITFALIIVLHSGITIASCVFMSDRAVFWSTLDGDKAPYRVRLELIWPSVYLIAIGIFCGYFFVESSLVAERVWQEMIPILIPMTLLLIYSVTTFSVSYFEDRKNAVLPRSRNSGASSENNKSTQSTSNSDFSTGSSIDDNSVDSFKAEKEKCDENSAKSVWIHVAALAILLLLPLGKDMLTSLSGVDIKPFQYMGLLFWATAIAAIFAMFESWAVAQRKKSDTDKFRIYIRSNNMVLISIMFLFPTVYGFAGFNGATITPYLLVAFAFVGLMFHSFRYKHRGSETPSKEEVRWTKICMVAVCLACLFLCEHVLTQFPSFNEKAMVFLHSTPLVLGITLVIMLFAATTSTTVRKIFSGVLEGFRVKNSATLGGHSSSTSSSDPNDDDNAVEAGDAEKQIGIWWHKTFLPQYENTENLWKHLQTAAVYGVILFGAIVFFPLYFDWPLPNTCPATYTCPATLIYFSAILLLSSVVRFRRGIEKYSNEDSKHPSGLAGGKNTSEEDVDLSTVSVTSKIRKISELLHVPSSMMIFILLFVPSIINGIGLGASLSRSLPLTLIAMAGFALNNYVDVRKDRINKPNRAIPSGVISRRSALLLSIALYLVSMVLSHISTNSLFVLTIYTLALLGTVAYSLLSKKIGYIKTLITGLLTITPFLVALHYYQPSINGTLFLLAVVMATIGKELLMDIRDIRGDSAAGYYTIATLFGKEKTQAISIVFSVVALVLYFFSFKFNTAIGLVITMLAAIIVFASYMIWFSKRGLKNELGIYLLWGSIIICSLPVLLRIT